MDILLTHGHKMDTELDNNKNVVTVSAINTLLAIDSVAVALLSYFYSRLEEQEPVMSLNLINENVLFT